MCNRDDTNRGQQLIDQKDGAGNKDIGIKKQGIFCVNFKINLLKFQRGDENFVANGILNVNYFKVGQQPFSRRGRPKKAKRL